MLPAALGPLHVVVLSLLGIFLLKAQASQVRHALNPPTANRKDVKVLEVLSGLDLGD